MSYVRRGDIIVFEGETEFQGTESGVGCVIRSKRPWVVVQNNKGNLYSTTTVVVPLTGRVKRVDLPTHVLLPTCGILKTPSTASCEQLRKMLERYTMRTITNEYLAELIREAFPLTVGKRGKSK